MGKRKEETIHHRENLELLTQANLVWFNARELNQRLGKKMPNIAGGIIFGDFDLIEGLPPLSLRAVYVAQEPRMPLRQLAYFLEVCQIAEAIKKQGLDIQELRIICPCYLNHLVNGINAQEQMARAFQAEEWFKMVKDRFSSLANVPLRFDFGQPINNENEQNLDAVGEMVREAISERLAALFGQMASNHSLSSAVAPELAPFLYLFDHGPAWGITSQKGISYFPPSSEALAVCFMPQSELPFIAGIAELVNSGLSSWQTSVALFSSRHVYPPYYRTSWEQSELASFDLNGQLSLPPKSQLSQLVAVLRGPNNRNSGDKNIARLIEPLNHLQVWL